MSEEEVKDHSETSAIPPKASETLVTSGSADEDQKSISPKEEPTKSYEPDMGVQPTSIGSQLASDEEYLNLLSDPEDQNPSTEEREEKSRREVARKEIKLLKTDSVKMHEVSSSEEEENKEKTDAEENLGLKEKYQILLNKHEKLKLKAKDTTTKNTLKAVMLENEQLSQVLSARIGELEELKLKISEYAAGRLKVISLEQENAELKEKLSDTEEKMKRAQGEKGQMMSSEMTLKMRLLQQNSRHEKETQDMAKKIGQLVDEIKKMQAIEKEELNSSSDENVKRLAEEVDSLRQQKIEQEEEWTKQLDDQKMQLKTDMGNLREQYDNERANFQTELAGFKERWKTEVEQHQSSTKELRTTIANLRMENADLEGSKKELDSLRSELQDLKSSQEIGATSESSQLLSIKTKEMEAARLVEITVLTRQIKSLTESCDEQKKTIAILKRKDASPITDNQDLKTDEPDDEDDFKFGIVQEKKSEPAESEVATGGIRTLQVEVDTGDQKSNAPSQTGEHHRKESMMLYIEVQPDGKQLVNVDSLQRNVAMLMDENKKLKHEIHGETILMGAIETMKKQLENLQKENSQLRLKEQAQEASYSQIVKSMTEKMKEKEDAENRITELEEELRDYNKKQAFPHIPDMDIRPEHKIYTHSETPSISKMEAQLRESLARVKVQLTEDNAQLLEERGKSNALEVQLLKEREENQGTKAELLKLMEKLQAAEAQFLDEKDKFQRTETELSEESEKYKAVEAQLLQEEQKHRLTEASLLEEREKYQAIEVQLLEEKQKHRLAEASLLDEREKYQAVEAQLLEETQKHRLAEASILEEREKYQAVEAQLLEEQQKHRLAEASLMEEREKYNTVGAQLLEEQQKHRLAEASLLEEREKYQASEAAVEAQLLEEEQKHRLAEASLLEEREKSQVVEAQLLKVREMYEAVEAQLAEETERLRKESDEENNKTTLYVTTTSDLIEEQKGTIKDLQSKVAELQAGEEEQKVVIRDIQSSLEKENKSQYIEELHAEMIYLKEEFRQKLELKDKVIRDGEVALNQSIEQSELKISNLQEEVLDKKNDLSMHEESKREEVEGLKERSMDLERQLTELRSEIREIPKLQEQVTQLSQNLETSQDETLQAVSTKIEIICTLAQEIERLRNNSSAFVSMKKNITQARLDRTSGPEYSPETDMPSLELSS